MTNLMQFDDAVARHNAAYAAFASMYEVRTPRPIATEAEKEDWVTKGALTVLVTASVIVSGSRTVVEFGGGLIGAAAFVMLELAIVAYGYIRTKRYYDESRHNSTKRLITTGMVLAFVVALAANIHATLKQNGILSSPAASSQTTLMPAFGIPQHEATTVDIVILVLVSISAPALAFIAGDVLGMEDVASRRRQRKAAEDYAEVLAKWQEGLNSAWLNSPLYRSVKVSVSSEGASALPPPSVSALSVADGQRTDSGRTAANNYTKKMDARTIVWTYLEQQPDAANLPVRELAVLLSVGKTTVSEVLNEWRKTASNR